MGLHQALQDGGVADVNVLLPTPEDKHDKELAGYDLYMSNKGDLLPAARDFWRPADASITLLGGGALVTSVTLLTAFGPSSTRSSTLLISGWICLVVSLICAFIAKWLMVLIYQFAINRNEDARQGGWDGFRDRLRDSWTKSRSIHMRMVRGVYISYSLACVLLMTGMIALLCYAAPTSISKRSLDDGKATPTQPAAPTSTASSAIRSTGTHGTPEGSVPDGTGRSASEAWTEQAE